MQTNTIELNYYLGDNSHDEFKGSYCYLANKSK